jgi:hypothetical protein
MNVETREIALEAVTAVEGDSDASTDESADVPGANESGTDASVAGVDPNNVDMTTHALTDDGRQFVNATGARPAGYISVGHSISNEDVDGATHQFRVRRSYLNNTGVGPDAVQLYRNESAGWNALETKYAGASGGFHHYTADSPGLSLFTIGAHTPVYELRNTRVVSGSLTTGNKFTVNTTVANVGNAGGPYIARLVADGAVVDSQRIIVPANETRTVRLEHTFTSAGQHQLAIGNQAFQSPIVTPGLPFGQWLLVLLGLIGGVLWFVLARRRDEEEEEPEPAQHEGKL